LLCTGAHDVACHECENCRLVMRHAHPDFHLVMPVSLLKEHRGSDGHLSEEGWKYLDKRCRERIADPYAAAQYASVPTIPLEWVREVSHAINRGAVTSGRSIAIIDGVDLMNKESANAMLKTLEEPPPGALIILITTRYHAVLPTVVSRCQLLRFGFCSPDEISRALAAHYAGANSDRITQAVAAADGNPGRARLLMDEPLEVYREVAQRLLALCDNPDWSIKSAGIEEIGETVFDSGRDFGAFEKVFASVMQLSRARFVREVNAPEKYITDTGVAPAAEPARNGRVLDACQQALSGARARGNVLLGLATFVITVSEILHDQEQQAG
jgi:hypothetical protein